MARGTTVSGESLLPYPHVHLGLAGKSSGPLPLLASRAPQPHPSRLTDPNCDVLLPQGCGTLHCSVCQPHLPPVQAPSTTSGHLVVTMHGPMNPGPLGPEAGRPGMVFPFGFGSYPWLLDLLCCLEWASRGGWDGW